MRKQAGPAVFFLVALGTTVTGWTHPYLGAVLMVVGLAWGMIAIPVVNDRLPSLTLDRGGRGEGFAIRFRPPKGGLRRRLRHETESLVADMHAYLATQPTSLSPLDDPRFDAATTEEERNAIWMENVRLSQERSEQERRQLTARFGGRLQHVLAEYQRLGLLEAREARRITWECESTHRAFQVAATLEATARRL